MNVVPDPALLPHPVEQRLTRLRDRVVQQLSHPHVLGLLIMLLAVTIVVLSLVPGALSTGIGPIAALTSCIGVIILLGLWLTFYPRQSVGALRWAATLSPVLWAVLWEALQSPERRLSPLLLLYSAAVCAATCTARQVLLNTTLCLAGMWLWVSGSSAALSGTEEVEVDTFLVMRFLGNGIILLAVPTMVYLMRRRAETLRAEVRRRSVWDALTGLPNRRHLELVAPRLVAQAGRQDREIFALTIDADRMATINDEHGHIVGDEVIRDVAAVLRRALRPEDVLVRTTGDQFIALGLSRNEWEAIRVAERVRQAVRKQPMRVPLTCSIGVASARVAPGLDPGEWIWNLTSVSEESLAAAKASGRDRVTGARQSGVVLGDALEVVTAPQSPDRSPVLRVPPARRFIPTVETAAHLLAATLALGVVLMLWFMFLGGIRGFAPGLLWAQGLVTIAMGTLAGLLLIVPRWFTQLATVTVFVADALWALTGRVASPDGYSPVFGILMAGVAAFLFGPRLLLAHIGLVYPLMWLQLHDPTRPALHNAGLVLAEGTLLNLATVVLYFVRLEGDNLRLRARSILAIDELTGLPDRRYLQQQAPAMVAGALRQQQPLSVIVVDIDDFGEVNDRVGYQGGDEALVAVARAVVQSCRPEDMVARLGGDDLAIVGNHPLAEAVTAAERARDAVSTVWVAGEPLTASVGVLSTSPPPGADPPTWLMAEVESATDAMHLARAEGGGRVVCADHPVAL